MSSLETLTQEARALGLGETLSTTALTEGETEVARQMRICNACRYCEGFCAVFPAMTRRLNFTKADVHYLANLCHNCGACLHACQYAPPHEFAVNVPQSMAQVRGQTYADYAWPSKLGQLYQRQGVTLGVALVIGFTLFLVLSVSLQEKGVQALWNTVNDEFYAIFPHNLLVSIFAPVFLFATLALILGVYRFLNNITPATSHAAVTTPVLIETGNAALTLKYLDGGHGDGCHNEDDTHTLSRRRYHHLTFYGFLLCFAATGLGTLYHYLLNLPAPYDLPSIPKILGALGGVSMTIGTIGLWRLNLRRHPMHGDRAQKTMDLGFIALLFLTATSGLLLWGARGTPALALMLCFHLGSIMALFLTLPYGKFAHGIYRTASLARYFVEKRQPTAIGLSSE